MKKAILIFFMFFSIISLASCNSHNMTGDKEIICEDVIRVYEEAGYEIFHKETADQDYDWNCYVKCTAPDSNDAIYFHFFETKEAAKEYSSETEWNILLYLYSVIAAEPTWVTTKTYNNIAIDYTKGYTYNPFKELI